MNITVALAGNVTDFKAYGDIKASDIDKNSFKVISYIGDLGRTDSEIAELFSFLLDLAMSNLSQYIREYDLSTLVPSDYSFILENIKDVGVVLGQ